MKIIELGFKFLNRTWVVFEFCYIFFRYVLQICSKLWIALIDIPMHINYLKWFWLLQGYQVTNENDWIGIRVFELGMSRFWVGCRERFWWWCASNLAPSWHGERAVCGRPRFLPSLRKGLFRNQNLTSLADLLLI